ncbi:MAG: hypothetical protein IJL17_18355 [Kiritimatiellae bacterium]|nr:hypothetical protein [Kiritimatiellia bacterium]
MKTLVAFMAIVAPALALVPVSNSFWDTTGYTGVAPAVSETAPIAEGLDSWTPRERVVGPLDKPFSSYPAGLFIIFR